MGHKHACFFPTQKTHRDETSDAQQSRCPSSSKPPPTRPRLLGRTTPNAPNGETGVLLFSGLPELGDKKAAPERRVKVCWVRKTTRLVFGDHQRSEIVPNVEPAVVRLSDDFFLNGQSAGLPGVPVALSELYPNPIPNIDASTGGVYRSKTQGKLIY